MNEMMQRIGYRHKQVLDLRGMAVKDPLEQIFEVTELLAAFRCERSWHNGVLIWGKPGTGKTCILKAMLQAMADESHVGNYPEEGRPIEDMWYIGACDLASHNSQPENFKLASKIPMLILDDLGLEQGVGEKDHSGQISIGELLKKRYDVGRPTIIASIFDPENIGSIYGSKVLDIILESYHVKELEFNFRKEIICKNQKFHGYNEMQE